MNDRWFAASLPIGDAALAARLRTRANLWVAVDGERLWLRGPSDADCDRALCSVAGLVRFELVLGNQLVPVGRRVATHLLPELPWMPIAEWFAPAPQVAALPAAAPAKTALTLVRIDRERPVDLLSVDLDLFLTWCETAPAVRLGVLDFAACAARDTDRPPRACVRGTPLPPLPGVQCTLDQGIAVPAGYALDPPLDPRLLRAALALVPGEVALFERDGRWTRLAADAFAAASRSGARATRRAVWGEP